MLSGGDNEGTGNGKQATVKNGGNGDKSKETEPKHIRDNAFLVEEAFNQEPGEVQHIFNWINLWDRSALGRSRNFAGTYTMELPLGTQKHQFSFTTQFLTAFEQNAVGVSSRQGGIGDTFLNYRYQLLDNDDFLWVAPRFSAIVPTGDKHQGFGTGEMGYQFNLPVSRYGDRFDYHFNAGLTITPHVWLPLAESAAPGRDLPMATGLPSSGGFSPRHDLRGYNLGASAYWKPRTDLHFFVETLALWNDEIDDRGFKNRTTQVFLNPGLRFAIIQDPVEWVLGISVPVGLTRETPDIGVFVYMSIEHSFRRKTNGE